MRRSRRATLATLPVAGLALVYTAPLALLVLGSLRPRGLPPPSGIELVPSAPTLDAYRLVGEVLPILTYLRNSLAVVAVAVPVSVLVASLAGFAIRTAPPRVRRWLLAGTILALLVPMSALWATRFALFRATGIIDTFVPLWSLGLIATSPFLVLIYAWAFGRVDDEQLDAAALDGAGSWRAWWHVGVPQVRAATLAVVTLSFVAHWGSFIDPLLYLQSTERYTLPLGLQLLQQLNPTDFPLLLAAATVATIPTVIAFGIGQRVFLHHPLRALRGGPR